MKNTDPIVSASRNEDSVQGHLREPSRPANRAEPTGPDAKSSRNLREEMESFMNDSGCRRVCLYFDRMNLDGRTVLRIEIVDKDALITTELTGDRAGAFYLRFTGDEGFLTCAAKTEPQ